MEQFIRTQVQDDTLSDLSINSRCLDKIVLIEYFGSFAALFFYFTDEHGSKGKALQHNTQLPYITTNDIPEHAFIVNQQVTTEIWAKSPEIRSKYFAENPKRPSWVKRKLY